MPCNSDYMEPTALEKELRETAKLILYIYVSRGKMGECPLWIRAQAMKARYATEKDLVPFLCAMLREMSEEEKETVMYDGRNPQARKLADWWDRHKEADAERMNLDPDVAASIDEMLATMDGLLKVLNEEQQDHLRMSLRHLRAVRFGDYDD